MLTVVLSPAGVASAQESPQSPPPTAQPQPQAPELRVERPATINGQAITSDDIEHHSRLLRGELPGAPQERIAHAARRAIAEEILLAGEAARLGVELAQRHVDDYWERRLGAIPDYAALAAATGSSVERQRELARRAALAETYLLHKVGLRTEQARRVPPDPQLTRHVALTPLQLREAFAQNRDLLSAPERIVLDLFACSDPSAARAIEAALVDGRPPPPDTPPAARRTLTPDQLPQAFPEAIADWIAAAEPGSLGAFEVTQGELLVAVRDRMAAQPADFAESQERLRRMLQNELIAEARQYLVTQLRQGATYFPPELFAERPQTAPAEPAPGAAPAAEPQASAR